MLIVTSDYKRLDRVGNLKFCLICFRTFILFMLDPKPAGVQMKVSISFRL